MEKLGTVSPKNPYTITPLRRAAPSYNTNAIKPKTDIAPIKFYQCSKQKHEGILYLTLDKLIFCKKNWGINFEKSIPISSINHLDYNESLTINLSFTKNKNKDEKKWGFTFQSCEEAKDSHGFLQKLVQNDLKSSNSLVTFSKWYGRVICTFDFE